MRNLGEFQRLLRLTYRVMNLRERFHVLIDAPEILVLRLADRAAVTGADGIDEHHVGLVEQGAGVVYDLVRGEAE